MWYDVMGIRHNNCCSVEVAEIEQGKHNFIFGLILCGKYRIMCPYRWQNVVRSGKKVGGPTEKAVPTGKEGSRTC